MRDQTTQSVLKHSNQLLLNGIDSIEPHAAPIGTPRSRDDFHEVLLELDLDYRVLLGFCDRFLLTTCNIFQTVWAIVVSCYAGIEDVLFVYGMSGWQFSSSEPERSYLWRAHVDSKKRLFDMLLAAKKISNDALDHGDHSIANHVDDLVYGNAPNLNSGLFVNHQLAPSERRSGKPDKAFSRCHILAQVTIRDDYSLSVSIQARAPKFSVAQAENISHTFQKALSEIIKAHPESLMEDLEICSQHDLKTILNWNRSIPGFVESCFHWVFETVARRTPNAAAICSWDRNFTYQELDAMSMKLANHLRYLGVKPETFVGICFNKTSTAYVCMLSILKAGGAFVAIDPSYPIDRIRTIAETSKASIFLAEPMYCHLFEDFTEHIMALDTQILDELPLRPSSPEPQSKPSDIAYVVFTSGSTGVPKGIMIEHRSLCTATSTLAAALGIDSSSRVLQFAAYTFDVSYGDTFVTLAQGGCICVPSEHERLNDISGAMVRMDVNNACLIPSMARMLRPENVPYLRVLNLGAEALLRDNVDTWADKLTLSVVYGPSECTVWCASQIGVKADTPPNTIGRGAGALLWVTSVTNHDRLCPIGCIGELLVEGPGLARGYLDTEETRTVFIENPSWAHTNNGHRRRFYKTGDLVRYQADGTLSFIGRKDTQIKLHGRRIELGEIEYHLAGHDLLKQSMVVLPSTGKYHHKLVAIVVFKATDIALRSSVSSEIGQITGADLQRYADDLANIKTFLSSRLPFYMLPQELIVVENIPLMVSGKMNRVLSRRFVENLKTAEVVHENEDDVSNYNDEINTTTHPPPNHRTIDSCSTKTQQSRENRMQQIWSEVLDIDIKSINVENNGFVSLGGDSLSAMDLVVRCKAEGYDDLITVADILENDRTIRQILAVAATTIDGETNEDVEAEMGASKVTAETVSPELGAKREEAGGDDGEGDLAFCHDHQGLIQPTQKQYKFTAASRPLVLRPIWWDYTDHSNGLDNLVA